MTRFEILFSLLRIPFDFLAVVLAGFLAYFLRPITDFIPFVQIPFPKENLIPLEVYTKFVIFSAFAFVLISFSQRLYTFMSTAGRLWEFFKIVLSSIILIFAIISFYALVETETFFSRGILFIMSILLVCLSFSFRMILRELERFFLKKGCGIRCVALFGKEKMRRKIASKINKSLYFVMQFESETFDSKKLDSNKVDEIWFTKTDGDDSGREILEYAQIHHLLYRLIPDVSGTLHAKVVEGTIGKYPLLAIYPTRLEGYGRLLKRMFDILASSILLLILFPFFLITAFIIKIHSEGPVFYVSERVGRNDVHFSMYKFRSMIVNADELKKNLEKENHRKDSPLFKVKNDPRITKLGRFLRRYSIDELPQLFNVFIGNMSLVGPRAHLPNEVAQYSLDQKRVLMIKPGITGLPQINGRSDLDFQEEIKLDLHYIVHWSLILDMKIILKTPWVLLKAEGAD